MTTILSQSLVILSHSLVTQHVTLKSTNIIPPQALEELQLREFYIKLNNFNMSQQNKKMFNFGSVCFIVKRFMLTKNF